MQRLLDIFISASALILLSPIFALIALLLRFTGEGEIFFLQNRVGKNGKLFNLVKFVTMQKNSPNIGTGTVTVKNDPRILPLGHFLRQSKLNELPQIFNILLGSMSFVGPRPQAPKNFEAFPFHLQKVINNVRPGLTGVGSIIFRNEELILSHQTHNIKYYTQVISPYKGEIEAWYVKNQSTYTYFMCLFITIFVVFRPSSSLVWRVFRNLPAPPKELAAALNYSFRK